MDFVTSASFFSHTIHSVVIAYIFGVQLAAVYLASRKYAETKDVIWLLLMLAGSVSALHFSLHALVVPGFLVFNEALFDIFEHYGLFLAGLILLVGIAARIRDMERLHHFRWWIIGGWFIGNVTAIASLIIWPAAQNGLFAMVDYATGASGIFLFLASIFFFRRFFASRKPVDISVASGLLVLVGSTILPFFYEEWNLLWWSNHGLFLLGNTLIFAGFVVDRRQAQQEDDSAERLPFYRKVKFKLVALILALTIIPLTTLGVYGAYIAEQSLRQQTVKDLEHIVRANSSHITGFIDLLKNTAANFSSDGLIRRLSEDIDRTPEDAAVPTDLLNRHLIKNKLPTNEYLVGINVIDARGRIISSTHEAEIGNDESADAYFIEGMRLPYGTSLIIDYGQSSHFGTREPLIATVAPLLSLESDRALGVIVTYFRIDTVALFFSNETRKEETLDVYLVNAESLLISQSRFSKRDAILTQRVDTVPVQSCRDGQDMRGIWENWRGKMVYGASVCLTELSTHWTLVVEIDEAEVIKPATTLKDLIIVAAMLLSVTIVFVALLSVSGTVSFVEQLSRLAKKINQGDLNDQVEAYSTDEVGLLAKNLDLMRETIKARAEALQKTNAGLVQADRELKSNIVEMENSKKAVMNLFEDVKESEEQLRRQTNELKKFQQAADKSFDQTIITDVDGTILYANHATELMTGYSMQEIIGARPSLWGKQMPKEHYETLWQTIKDEKQGYAGELTNKRKDGTQYLASIRISPILDEKGEVKFFVGVTRDITEERKSQLRIVRHAAELQEANTLIEQQKERAESILRFLKSIGEGIFATDTSGRVIFMNETAEVLSKRTFQEAELKPANKIFCFAKETEAGCSELTFVTKALQKKQTITLPDHTVLVHDEQKRIPVSGTCAPIRDANNEIVGTITVFQDVTKKHELDQMKDSFLSVAAHQLRTPLGSMRWSMELLLGGDLGKLPKAAHDGVQQLYDNSQRMVTLVNDLLDISRIEQSRGSEEKKLVSIVEIVKEVLSQLQSEADKKHVQMVLDVPKDFLPNILVAPKHIHEAIENLLSNAIKYNRDHGTVTITLAKKATQMELTIKDTGIGIPKDDHSKIFSKFFRATNAVLKETEGSGLGLSVVKSYLEESRARVSFESEENVGTTFLVEFPLDPTAGIS